MQVSFHKYGDNFFPGTGAQGDVGHASGKGYSINVPLREGMDDESYKFVYEPIMKKVMAVRSTCCSSVVQLPVWAPLQALCWSDLLLPLRGRVLDCAWDVMGIKASLHTSVGSSGPIEQFRISRSTFWVAALKMLQIDPTLLHTHLTVPVR